MPSGKTLAFASQVLFLAATICMQPSDATIGICPCPPPPSMPATNTLVFYFQDISSNGTNNNNSTTTPVAGIQGKAFSETQYGTIYVSDDNITATTSRNSAILGRSQGTLSVAALNGAQFLSSITFSFTGGQYDGSTLVTLGIANGIQIPGTVSIVGGTNSFLYATGNLTFQLVSMLGSYAIVKVTAIYQLPA